MSRQEMKGSIANYFPNKGFGFIRPEGSNNRQEEYFFHIDDCANLNRDTITIGQAVVFSGETTTKGLRARNVVA